MAPWPVKNVFRDYDFTGLFCFRLQLPMAWAFFIPAGIRRSIIDVPSTRASFPDDARCKPRATEIVRERQPDRPRLRSNRITKEPRTESERRQIHLWFL